MKGLTFYFLLLAALTGLYVYTMIHQPDPIDWSPTYSREDKIPFGTYIFFHELSSIFPGALPAKSGQSAYSTADSTVTGSCYLLIAPVREITETDLTQLTSYIAAGNQVFVAAKSWDSPLTKRFRLVPGNTVTADSAHPVSVSLTAAGDKSRFSGGESQLNACFEKFDKKGAEILGINSSGKVNFIRYAIGKGWIYLHANPEVFSNYFLLRKNNAAYTAMALSKLDPNIKTVIWDEYYQLHDPRQATPLRYILSQPALKFAWFTALSTLLLFLVFESKRKQRFLPVINPVTNTTIEFTETIAMLYFKQRNNNDLALKLVTQFRETVSSRFNIQVTDFSEEELVLLSAKTQTDIGFLRQLAGQIKEIIGLRSSLSDQELLSLNQQIEKFYTLLAQ